MYCVGYGARVSCTGEIEAKIEARKAAWRRWGDLYERAELRGLRTEKRGPPATDEPRPQMVVQGGEWRLLAVDECTDIDPELLRGE